MESRPPDALATPQGGLHRVGPHSRLTFPVLMGGFGVIMGFATFVLVQDEREKTDQASLLPFAVGLVAAALTSFVIETVRTRAEGKGAEREPVSAGRVLGLLILLGLFELFAAGADSLSRLVFSDTRTHFLAGVFSTGTTPDPAVGLQLLLFAGLWIVLGCATGWAASGAIAAAPPSLSRRQVLSSVVSVLKGLAAVALFTLFYVCVARLGYTAYVIATTPDQYQPDFTLLLGSRTTVANPFDAVRFGAVMLAQAVATLAHSGGWGRLGAVAGALAVLAALVGVIRLGTRSAQMPYPYAILCLMLGGALVLVALGPFATNGRQFGQLVHIVIACTSIWLSPLIVLSVAAPWLRAPAQNPRVWGVVALGVALILVLITWQRLSDSRDRLFVGLAFSLLAYTAVSFLRGANLREFWQLAALTMAVATFELGTGLGQLNFLNTYKSFALLQSARLEADVAHAAGEGYSVISAWHADGSIDATTAALVKGVEALWNLAEVDQALASIDALATDIGSQRRRLLEKPLDLLCAPTGSPWVDTLHADMEPLCGVARQAAEGIAVKDPGAALRDAPPPAGTGMLSLVREIRSEVDDAATTGASDGRPGLSDETDVVQSLLGRTRPPPIRPTGPQIVQRSDVGPASKRSELELLQRFVWASPDTPAMRALARTAREQLAERDRDLGAAETARLLDPSAHRTATERGWLLLSILSRSAPPGGAVIDWAQSFPEREQLGREIHAGFTLEDIDALWSLRTRVLASLVDAAQATMPASTTLPHSPRLDAMVPEDIRHLHRTLIALGFASAQLGSLRSEIARGEVYRTKNDVVLDLELALGACFAFWATAGLLAGSARQQSMPAA